MIASLADFIKELIPVQAQGWVHTVLCLSITTAVALIAFALMRLLMKILDFFVKRSGPKWDDYMLNERFQKVASLLGPAMVVRYLLPRLLYDGDLAFSHTLVTVTRLVVVASWTALAYVSVKNLYVWLHKTSYKRMALESFFNAINMVVVFIGFVIGLSIVLGKEPAAVVGMFGASAALLSLVFKDTILGIVASFQLVKYEMLHNGDWIVVDAHNINGEVEKVTLTTVKVKNWDNSISTIQPYKLITESFRNYQNMREVGARKVERAIIIDLNSIRFLHRHEIQKLIERGLINENETPTEVNISLLRHYLTRYLRENAKVVNTQLLMVRQLQPTAAGLPVQLFFFISDTQWEAYERTVCDIFDHIYAVVQEFGLRMYQAPAGSDIEALKPGLRQ